MWPKSTVYRHYAISNQPALPDDAVDLLKPEDWVCQVAFVFSDSRSVFAILSLFCSCLFYHRAFVVVVLRLFLLVYMVVATSLPSAWLSQLRALRFHQAECMIESVTR